MGQSSSSQQNKQETQSNAPATFRSPIVLQGLRGSGVSSVKDRMQLQEKKLLTIDQRFITSPPILSTEWGSPNRPAWDGMDKLDRNLWAYGGRGSLSSVWSIVARSCKALCFVVDCSNRAQINAAPEGQFPPLPENYVNGYFNKSPEEQEQVLHTLSQRMNVKDTLHFLLGGYELSRKPVLILANKQDVEGAVEPQELAELLGMPSLVGRDWRVSGCCAKTGEGLQEAFDWLSFIIASPTDFTEVYADIAKADQFRWQQQSLDLRRTQLLEKYEKKKADLQASVVEQAPSLLRPDGTEWQPTEEQRKQFVVRPVTDQSKLPGVLVSHEQVRQGELDRLEEEQQKLTADVAAYAAKKALKDALLNPIPIVAEPKPAPPMVKESWLSPSLELLPSKEPRRGSASAESDATAEPSLARTESPVESDVGSVRSSSPASASDVEEDEAARVPRFHEDPPAFPEKKSPLAHTPFSAVSSTSVVLPLHPSSMKEVKFVYRKRAWYSRKLKLLPAPSEAEEEDVDIHKVVGFYNRAFGLLL